MAYINTKFSVGQTVFWHDDEQDAVLRGTVTEITAASRDATSYGGGTFEITYVVKGKDFEGHFPEGALTARPEFPEPLPEAAPEAPVIPEPEYLAPAVEHFPHDPF